MTLQEPQKTMSGNQLAVATVEQGFPEGFEVAACLRPLQQWGSVPDSELPVPREYIAVRAYYRHVKMGRLHGFDKIDWVVAEQELRTLFRECVRSLEESLLCILEPEGEDHERGGRSPKKWEAADGNPIRPGSSDSDSFKEERGKMTEGTRALKTKQDEWGNIWYVPPIARSTITSDEYVVLFHDYRAIMVECETDLVYLAGNDLQAMERSLVTQGYDPANFAFEPGSFEPGSFAQSTPARS